MPKEVKDIRKLKGAFSLINILEDDDQIDSIICKAIENNLDINELSVEECLLEAYC